MQAVAEILEEERLSHVKNASSEHKENYGQYFTPYSVAKFMASLFPHTTARGISLLDPGAGIGILSCAFLERIKKENWKIFQS